MGEKHTGICVPNSGEMHLLRDCEDLVSMQRKLVPNVIIGIQTNLYWENPLFVKFYEQFDDSASRLKESNLFQGSQSAATFNSLGRWSAVIVFPLSKDIHKFPWPVLPFSYFEYPPTSNFYQIC